MILRHGSLAAAGGQWSTVGWVSRLVDRVAVVCRRITGAPDWPLAAAALLALLATIEVVQRLSSSAAAPSPAGLSTAVLLGLLTTAPLAVVRSHDLAAAVAIALPSIGRELGLGLSGPAAAIDGGSAAGRDALAQATVAIGTITQPEEALKLTRCSGVLIAPDLVLTAAHCVNGDPLGALVVYAPCA